MGSDPRSPSGSDRPGSDPTHSGRFVAVTAVGVVSPLGGQVQSLVAPAAALRRYAPLVHVPGGDWAGVVEGPDIRPWLRRRKDRKVMARASILALAAAGPALADFDGDLVDLALYLGVGREPPDDGESEPALAASAALGCLDEALLAGPGRDLYPPLLPLKTLPNMALAHVSMNLGAMGENNAWAGHEAASLRAIVTGARAVTEGRAPAALVGGADSLVDLGSARDRLRRGCTGPPGEAAAMLLLEPVSAARPALAWLEVVGREHPGPVLDAMALRAAIGDVGAAEGAVLAVAALAHIVGGSGPLVVRLSDPGQPPVSVRLQAPLSP